MSKKLTMKNVDKLLSKKDDLVTLQITVEGGTIDVEIKKNIALSDLVDIVDSVVLDVFSEGYKPEFKEAVTFKYLLEVMTNIPVPTTTLKVGDEDRKVADLEKCFELRNILMPQILRSDLGFPEVIYNIEALIDEKIEYKKNLIYNYRDNGDILRMIETTFSGVSELTEVLHVFADKLGGLVDTADEKLKGLDITKLGSLIK